MTSPSGTERHQATGQQRGFPPDSRGWHQLGVADVLRDLHVDRAIGLGESEAARRLAEYGRNQIVEAGAKSAWRILWEQFTELMVVILIVAAAISLVLKDYKDAAAILVIVVLNALLGFMQESRAEKAMAALKKLSSPSVRVRRDGEAREIAAERIVPGDVVLLEAGVYVPADCRLTETASLQTQESALTGESEPVRKTTAEIEQADAALGDRHNMAYMGTFVAAGRGEAVVTSTGMGTELGRIAGLIHGIEREPTPLQKRLSHLGKRLAAAALVVVAIIFVAGWIRGENIELLFLTAVSIGVAAIPEGLPAVVTIALTLGAQRMLKRKALIRKLSAVETLGSVTVICSDKTGTLTENRMAVEILVLPEEKLDISKTRQASDEGALPAAGRVGFELLLMGAALCNDAVLRSDTGEAESPAALGDPTEIALLVAAARFGLKKSALDRSMPRVGEQPFTSERKRMTTIHRIGNDSQLSKLEAAIGGDESRPYIGFAKGSVEALLAVCGTILTQDGIAPLDQSWRERIVASNDALASKGERVLGVACRRLAASEIDADESAIEKDLTYVGMLGLIDPPRPEAASAVALCKHAGIQPVMITGDHPLTARHIAGELGIDGSNGVVTGTELQRMAGADLDAAVDSVRVYARVSPEHKLKIVESLQHRGNVVAMTGDGVNDAPALKKADIGVAMGITGTEVAKEAADTVLLDDNFATIVAAVEEGRVIYDNLRKFVRYILATNSGEIFVMLLAPFFGMPLPLLPLQILWMNLVTDGLPALALTMEPAETDLMQRPPRDPKESLFARGMGRQVIWVGLMMGALSLAVAYGYWHMGDPRWQTVLFTTLTLAQMANVLAIRSERQSLFRIGIFSNKPLLGAVALTVGFQLAIVYWPVMQNIFKTTALTGGELALSTGVPLAIFAAVEIEKWMIRRCAKI